MSGRRKYPGNLHAFPRASESDHLLRVNYVNCCTRPGGEHSFGSTTIGSTSGSVLAFNVEASMLFEDASKLELDETLQPPPISQSA